MARFAEMPSRLRDIPSVLPGAAPVVDEDPDATSGPELSFAQLADLRAEGGALWWLDRLSARLIEKRRRTQVYWDYYHGNHRLLFATPKFREAFGTLFSEFADNWTRVVVDTPNSRLKVAGFRVDKNTDSDQDAWAWWQSSRMAARSRMAHRAAFIGEESAVGVWWGLDDQPQITVMDPTEVTVEMHSDGVTRLAALRMWIAPSTGIAYANVYLPNGIWKFRASGQAADALSNQLYLRSYDRPSGGAGAPGGSLWLPPGFLAGAGGWQPAAELGDKTWPLENPLQVVPVIPLVNRAHLNGVGESELRDIIPIQDAINKTLMDGQVNSEFIGFPQRWMIGDVARDAKGDPIEPFDLAADRILFNTNVEGKFGAFPEGTNNGLRDWIDMLVGHVASMSSTPVHYFAGLKGTQFPSGDALRAAEAGLTSKVREKAEIFGDAWQEAVRLAFRIRGRRKDIAKSKITTTECLWEDPEYRSESEHMDAISKARGIGVPQRILWEQAGYTPSAIARFEDLLIAEAKFAKRLAEINPPPVNTNPNVDVLPAPPGAPVDPEIRGDRINA